LHCLLHIYITLLLLLLLLSTVTQPAATHNIYVQARQQVMMSILRFHASLRRNSGVSMPMIVAMIVIVIVAVVGIMVVVVLVVVLVLLLGGQHLLRHDFGILQVGSFLDLE
jgi:hypothetical protein